MTLTFVEVELSLEAVRDRLSGNLARHSSGVTPPEAPLESCVDWDRLVLDAVRQQLPEGKLLRWAITSVCTSGRVATVEV
ncbi:MAG: hypothetical protein AAGJ55_03890, partial [Cyanobacteria bacterium J06555_12]